MSDQMKVNYKDKIRSHHSISFTVWVPTRKIINTFKTNNNLRICLNRTEVMALYIYLSLLLHSDVFLWFALWPSS